MATSKRGSWKGERASVNTASKPRPRTNKYSKSDSKKKPGSGSRDRVWVGGYRRADGSKVSGYYRDTPR
jgi:hypothetical protein